jgi:hypothetical protein
MDGLTTAVADDRRPPHSSYLTFSSSLLFKDDQAYYRHVGGGERDGANRRSCAPRFLPFRSQRHCGCRYCVHPRTTGWIDYGGRKKDGNNDDIDIDYDYDYDDGRSWSWALSKPYDRASSPGGSASSTGNDGDSWGGTSDDRADEDDIDDSADVFLRRNVSFGHIVGG